MVTVRDPAEVDSPLRLKSVAYQRPDAHLKHLATGQAYYSRLARRSGFDDALLVAKDGAISESATANVGFFDDEAVVWPDAPLLHGTTMQLLERALPDIGVASHRRPVHLPDIPVFEGVFLTSARGVALVTRIDDVELEQRPDRIKVVEEAYASVPWDPI